MTLANPTDPGSPTASRDATRRAIGVLRRPLQRPELASLGGLGDIGERFHDAHPINEPKRVNHHK